MVCGMVAGWWEGRTVRTKAMGNGKVGIQTKCAAQMAIRRSHSSRRYAEEGVYGKKCQSTSRGRCAMFAATNQTARNTRAACAKWHARCGTSRPARMRKAKVRAVRVRGVFRAHVSRVVKVVVVGFRR